jgi:hypothetical protein
VMLSRSDGIIYTSRRNGEVVSIRVDVLDVYTYVTYIFTLTAAVYYCMVLICNSLWY